MKFVLSLILSFFSIDKIHLYKLDHLFSVYDSLFFFFLYFIYKEKNGLFSYIRYIIYSPCSSFTMRYHQHTSCCALFCLEQQPTQCKRERNQAQLFFIREEKDILSLDVLRTYGKQIEDEEQTRYRGVCVWVCR